MESHSPIHQNVNGNDNIVAGRDVNFFQGTQLLETLLPDTERYGPHGSYLPPAFADALEIQVTQAHLVVVSGNPVFQKSAFLRYLAHRLLTYHPRLTLKVLQHRGDSNGSVRDILNSPTAKQPMVLIIDDVTPIDMLGNLIEVASIAKSRGHFVVASSQQPLSKWGLKPELVNKLWFEVPAGRLVSEANMIRHLQDRLETDGQRFKALTALRGHPHYSAFIARAASRLQSPEQCEAFIELLRYEDEPIQEQRLLELAEVTGGDPSAFMHIYHARLPEKYKLLLMAAALFKGLNERQFFRLADQLVEDGWQYRAIELKALDYCDLDAIKEFYAFDRNTENSLLSSSYDQIDLAVLSESRYGYRRHLLKALELIKKTIASSGSAKDKKENMHLRRRLSESLAKLLLVAKEDAEPKLAELARDANYNGKPNAAHAIAYLRELGRFDLMLVLVDDWLAQSENALQVTAMSALAIAAKQDRPNHLDNEIKQRLIAAAKHENAAVRDNLQNQMQSLLSVHPIQMAEEIVQNILVRHDVLNKRDYFDQIAKGLADAAYNYPAEVWRLVDRWLQSAAADLERSGKGQHTSGRDRLLIIALKTIQLLPLERSEQFPPMEAILARLTAMRAPEQQPAVRGTLMATILELLKRIDQLDAAVWQNLMAHSITTEQLALVEALGDMLLANKLPQPAAYTQTVLETFQRSHDLAHRQQMLEKLRPALQYMRPLHAAFCTQCLAQIARMAQRQELPLLPQLIGHIYQYERMQLQGGDFTFEVRGVQIPSFMQGRRETQIEQDMIMWIASDDRRLRKLGLLAFMEFGTVCDLVERSHQRSWVPPAPAPSPDPIADGAEGFDEPGHQDVAGESSVMAGSGGIAGRMSQVGQKVSFAAAPASIPLKWQLWGCISVLFAPRADRQRFWQAIGTIYRKPARYDAEAVQFTLQRIAHSGLPVTQGLATRIRRLYSFLKATN